MFGGAAQAEQGVPRAVQALPAQPGPELPESALRQPGVHPQRQHGCRRAARFQPGMVADQAQRPQQFSQSS